MSLPGLAHDVTGHDGPAVVHLHGLTSSRARESALRLDLVAGLASSARVLRFDARGHGRSPGPAAPDAYTWPRLAEDLLALLDETFPGEPVHLVGTSMGAATSLHAALLSPGHVASLALALPPTAWATRRDRAGDYEAVAALVEARGPQALEDDTLGSPPPAAPEVPATRPDVPAALLASVLRGAARSDLPSPERIAAITVPSLVLAWVDDPAHPLTTATTLVETLADARLQVARTADDVDAWPGLVREHVLAATRGQVTRG